MSTGVKKNIAKYNMVCNICFAYTFSNCFAYKSMISNASLNKGNKFSNPHRNLIQSLFA